MNNKTFVPSVSTSEAPQKRKRSIFLKIFAGLIILAIAGLGLALVTRAYNPLWNPFRPSPEKVLAKTVSQMKELKTYHNKTAFVIDSKNKEEVKIEGDFSGDSDITNSDNSKSAGKFNLKLAMEGMQISLAGEGKEIGEDAYFKLTTIPVLPMLEPLFALMGVDLQEFKNQWVKFDEESVKEIFPSEMPKEFEKKLEEQKKEKKEMKEKIKKLIANKKLYFLKTELADEKIGKVKTYHYILELDKEKVKKLIPEFLNIIIGEEEIRTMPGDQEKIQEEINQSFDKTGEITAEIWIGKKNYCLYKLNLEKEIDLAIFEKNKKGTVTVNFITEFNKFNKLIEITAPEEFKTIEEILTPKSGIYSPNQ